MKAGHWLERRLQDLTIWRAVRLVVVLALLIVVCAAVLERLAEPDTFTSIGIALWFAISTVGTVGYGDYTPHTGLGRLIAGGTILFSMALIPTITSLVVAALVTRVQRERGTSDAARLEEISQRLAAMEQRLAQVPGAPTPEDTG
jgi:voltage-gated potassium channel